MKLAARLVSSSCPGRGRGFRDGVSPDMSGSFERRFGGIAAALVETSRSRPWLVVALCALLTAGSVYVTATILEIDTDTDRLLSPELRVGQTNRALAEAFPDLQNNLVRDGGGRRRPPTRAPPPRSWPRG